MITQVKSQITSIINIDNFQSCSRTRIRNITKVSKTWNPQFMINALLEIGIFSQTDQNCIL